jgi:hypothetical protein
MNLRDTPSDLRFALYKLTPKLTVLPVVTNGGTLSVFPLPGNNVVQLSGPIDNSAGTVNFQLTIDSSNSQTGDTVILRFSRTSPLQLHEILMTVPSNVLITSCGTAAQILPVQMAERIEIILTFDGTKFLCTYDNC